MEKLKCPKCLGSITRDKKHVSKGYYGACLSCDEDFYESELICDNRITHLVHYDRNTLMNTESGILYDKITRKIIGQNNA